MNEENKYSVFDMVFVGDLTPNKNLMSKGVILATNNSADIY